MKITLTTLVITLTISGCSSNKPTVQNKKKSQSTPVVIKKKPTPIPVSIQNNTQHKTIDIRAAKQYYKMGQKYWNQNNFIEALDWMKKASDAGSQSGHIDAGRIYHDGKGNVAVNYPQAIKYYSRAAMNNNHGAQYRLGKMYYYGTGVKQDYFKALKYFRKASAAKKKYIAGTSFGTYPLGSAEADNSIAYMFAMGHGVQRNLGLAETLFLQSNEKSSTTLSIRNIATIKKLKQNSCFSHKPFDLASCNQIASTLSFEW